MIFKKIAHLNDNRIDFKVIFGPFNKWGSWDSSDVPKLITLTGTRKWFQNWPVIFCYSLWLLTTGHLTKKIIKQKENVMSQLFLGIGLYAAEHYGPSEMETQSWRLQQPRLYFWKRQEVQYWSSRNPCGVVSEESLVMDWALNT